MFSLGLNRIMLSDIFLHHRKYPLDPAGAPIKESEPQGSDPNAPAPYHI